jgi:hypothetical protein
MSPAEGPRPAAPHPVLNAMLISDQAIREEHTGKVSLIGIFENIYSTAFPSAHPGCAVYVKVTDAFGDYDLSLDLVRVDDLQILGQGRVHATVGDRLNPAEWVFNLNGLIFERPGRYEFRLSANGQHVASKTFSVILSNQAPVQGG